MISPLEQQFNVYIDKFQHGAEDVFDHLKNMIQDPNFLRIPSSILGKNEHPDFLFMLLQASQAHIQEQWDFNNQVCIEFQKNLGFFISINSNENNVTMSLCIDILTFITLNYWPSFPSENDESYETEYILRVGISFSSLSIIAKVLYKQLNDPKYRNQQCIQQLQIISSKHEEFDKAIQFLLSIIETYKNKSTFVLLFNFISDMSKIYTFEYYPEVISTLFVKDQPEVYFPSLSRLILTQHVLGNTDKLIPIDKFFEIFMNLQINSQLFIENSDFFEMFTDLAPKVIGMVKLPINESLEQNSSPNFYQNYLFEHLQAVLLIISKVTKERPDFVAKYFEILEFLISYQNHQFLIRNYWESIFNSILNMIPVFFKVIDDKIIFENNSENKTFQTFSNALSLIIKDFESELEAQIHKFYYEIINSNSSEEITEKLPKLASVLMIVLHCSVEASKYKDIILYFIRNLQKPQDDNIYLNEVVFFFISQINDVLHSQNFSDYLGMIYDKFYENLDTDNYKYQTFVAKCMFSFINLDFYNNFDIRRSIIYYLNKNKVKGLMEMIIPNYEPTLSKLHLLSWPNFIKFNEILPSMLNYINCRKSDLSKRLNEFKMNIETQITNILNQQLESFNPSDIDSLQTTYICVKMISSKNISFEFEKVTLSALNEKFMFLLENINENIEQANNLNLIHDYLNSDMFSIQSKLFKKLYQIISTKSSDFRNQNFIQFFISIPSVLYTSEIAEKLFTKFSSYPNDENSQKNFDFVFTSLFLMENPPEEIISCIIKFGYTFISRNNVDILQKYIFPIIQRIIMFCNCPTIDKSLKAFKYLNRFISDVEYEYFSKERQENYEPNYKDQIIVTTESGDMTVIEYIFIEIFGLISLGYLKFAFKYFLAIFSCKYVFDSIQPKFNQILDEKFGTHEGELPELIGTLAFDHDVEANYNREEILKRVFVLLSGVSYNDPDLNNRWKN